MPDIANVDDWSHHRSKVVEGAVITGVVTAVGDCLAYLGEQKKLAPHLRQTSLKGIVTWLMQHKYWKGFLVGAGIVIPAIFLRDWCIRKLSMLAERKPSRMFSNTGWRLFVFLMNLFICTLTATLPFAPLVGRFKKGSLLASIPLLYALQAVVVLLERIVDGEKDEGERRDKFTLIIFPILSLMVVANWVRYLKSN